MNESCHRHDISDALWELIAPHVIGEKGAWGGNAKNTRLFINAVFWILRTGAPWRDLPSSYGNWNNDASFVKAHKDAHGAAGGSQDIGRSKGGLHQRYILPWTRMVVRSESLSLLVSQMTAQKLANFKRA